MKYFNTIVGLFLAFFRDFFKGILATFTGGVALAQASETVNVPPAVLGEMVLDGPPVKRHGSSGRSSWRNNATKRNRMLLKKQHRTRHLRGQDWRTGA